MLELILVILSVLIVAGVVLIKSPVLEKRKKKFENSSEDHIDLFDCNFNCYNETCGGDDE